MAKRKSAEIQLFEMAESFRRQMQSFVKIAGKRMNTITEGDSVVTSQVVDACTKKMKVKKSTDIVNKSKQEKGPSTSQASKVSRKQLKAPKVPGTKPIEWMCERCGEIFLKEQNFKSHEAVHIFDANYEELAEYVDASPTKKTKKSRRKKQKQSKVETERTATLKSQNCSTSMTQQSSENDDNTSKRCSTSMMKQSARSDYDVIMDDVNQNRKLVELTCSPGKPSKGQDHATATIISKTTEFCGKIALDQKNPLTIPCLQNSASSKCKKIKRKRSISSTAQSSKHSEKFDSPKSLKTRSPLAQEFTTALPTIPTSSIGIPRISVDPFRKLKIPKIFNKQEKYLPDILPKLKKKASLDNAVVDHAGGCEVRSPETTQNFDLNEMLIMKKRTRTSTAEKTAASKSRKLSRNEQKNTKSKNHQAKSNSKKCQKQKHEEIGFFESMARHVSELQLNFESNSSAICGSKPDVGAPLLLGGDQYSTQSPSCAEGHSSSGVVTIREVNTTHSQPDNTYENPLCDGIAGQSILSTVADISNCSRCLVDGNNEISEIREKPTSVLQSSCHPILPLCALPPSDAQTSSDPSDKFHNTALVGKGNSNHAAPASITETVRLLQQEYLKRVEAILQKTPPFFAKEAQNENSETSKTITNVEQNCFSSKTESPAADRHSETVVTGDSSLLENTPFSMESAVPIIPISDCHEMIPWVIAEQTPHDNLYFKEEKEISRVHSGRIEPIEIRERSPAENLLQGDEIQQALAIGIRTCHLDKSRTDESVIMPQNSSSKHSDVNLENCHQKNIFDSTESQPGKDRFHDNSKEPKKCLSQVNKYPIHRLKPPLTIDAQQSESEHNSQVAGRKSRAWLQNAVKPIEFKAKVSHCGEASKFHHESTPKLNNEIEPSPATSAKETECVSDSHEKPVSNSEQIRSTIPTSDIAGYKRSANQKNIVKSQSSVIRNNHSEKKNVEYWIELDSEYTKAFMEGLKRPRSHQCLTCDRCFCSPLELKRHILIHTESKTFPCKFCGRTFMTLASLKYHKTDHKIQDNLKLVIKDTECKKPVIKRIKKPKTFTCTKCNQKIFGKSQYILHTKAPKAGFACRICVEVFLCKGLLQQHHIKAHNNMTSDIMCLECGRRFYAAAYLENHIKVHSSENKIICVICGESFRLVRHLKQHIEYHCDDTHGFVCEICGHPFVKSLELRNHKKIHRFEGETTIGNTSLPEKGNSTNNTFRNKPTAQEKPAVVSDSYLNYLPTEGECGTQKLEPVKRKRTGQIITVKSEKYEENLADPIDQSRKPLTQASSAEQSVMEQISPVPCSGEYRKDDGGITDDYNVITNCEQTKSVANKRTYNSKKYSVSCSTHENLLSHMDSQHTGSSDSSDKEDWKPSEDTSQESSEDYSDIEPSRRRQRCRICSRVFLNNSSLLRHMHVQHREQTLL